MTHLDSIFKSRDITLPTKVHLVKACKQRFFNFSLSNLIAFYLFFWAPKSLQMVTAAMELKNAYSLEGKLWPT